MAIIGGLGRLGDTPVVVLGHEKGNSTESRLQRNLEWQDQKDIEKLSYEISRQVWSANNYFIDTPGAYPGKGAEERG